MLDPMPRLVLVPGLGLFGLGRSKKDARIAADLAEAAIATITDAEAVGRFEPLPESDLFDVEYWSLEQAKLSSVSEPPLAGRWLLSPVLRFNRILRPLRRSRRPARKSPSWISTRRQHWRKPRRSAARR